MSELIEPTIVYPEDEDPSPYELAEQESLIRAEHMMGWITFGGDPADASAYAFQEMHGGPANPMTGELCEHGLDAGLCAGPGHYPMDM